MGLDLEGFELRARSAYPRQSLSRRLSVLRRYGRFLEESGLEPGLESLNLWLDELSRRGYSPGTLRVYAYDVLGYFDLMMLDVDERRLRATKRRLPPQGSPRVSFLTEEEVSRLIKYTPSPVRRLIYSLCYAYARRLGEVLSLRWSDVDLEGGRITFTILKKRGEERATYELEPWIGRMFLEYRGLLGGGRVFEVSERAVQRGFKRDCRLAGIEPAGRRLTPHVLRHSRITHLRQRGVPLDLVSRALARHSRYDTTVQFYRGVSEEEVRSIPRAEEVLR